MDKTCSNCIHRRPPQGFDGSACLLDSKKCLDSKSPYSLWEQKELPEEKEVSLNPSVDQSISLIHAFDYLNNKLFEGVLPRPMLIFTRNPKVIGGYYSPSKWFNSAGDGVDEIAINANSMVEGDEIELFQVLIHEMTHQWQQWNGTPGRGGYHNREWADFALSIGLKPINTSDPDAETGDTINTILIKGGKAMLVLANMPEEISIPFYAEILGDSSVPDKAALPEQTPTPAPKAGKRMKYTCPKCGTNLWGKAKLNIMCIDCNTIFVETK